MAYKDGKLHPEIQAAVDSRPAVLEPWGMFHILEACDKIAQERDTLKAELAALRPSSATTGDKWARVRRLYDAMQRRPIPAGEVGPAQWEDTPDWIKDMFAVAIEEAFPSAPSSIVAPGEIALQQHALRAGAVVIQQAMGSSDWSGWCDVAERAYNAMRAEQRRYEAPPSAMATTHEAAIEVCCRVRDQLSAEGNPIWHGAQRCVMALCAEPAAPTQDRIDAEEACRDIFNDFAEHEIKTETTSVRNAWAVGKALSATRDGSANGSDSPQIGDDKGPIDYSWQSTPALWAATRKDTYDGAPDSHCPIGFGKTQEEAAADLIEKEAA